MLAQLQIKFGVKNLQRYEETMVLVKNIFESEGIMLRHGLITKVGRLYQAWNIWEIEDQGHVSRAMNNAVGHPELPDALSGLSEVVESEVVHYLESLAFSGGR